MGKGDSSNEQSTTTTTTNTVTTNNYGLSDVEGSILATEGSTVNVTDGGAIAAMADTSARAFELAQDLSEQQASGMADSLGVVHSSLGTVGDVLAANVALSESVAQGANDLAMQSNRSEGENVSIQFMSGIKYAAIAAAVIYGIKALK